MTQTRSFASSTIHFGAALAVPVKIYSAASRETVEFSRIHKGCGVKLTDTPACPKHGTVSKDEIAKGYEVAPDQYLELEEEEIAEIRAELPASIDVIGTLLSRLIPPVAFEKAYYLGPNKGGDDGFAAVREGLAQRQAVALATSVIKGKKSLAAIAPYGSVLVLHHLFYAGDVREPPVLEQHVDLNRKQLQLAAKLVDLLELEKFDFAAHQDEQLLRAKHLIEKRVRGDRRIKGDRMVVDTNDAPPARVIDLTTALEQSLSAGLKPPAKRKAG